MDLSKITIKNFKGINHIEFDLSKSPHNNVYTFVGINESGKTTILEAINFFEYNDEKTLNKAKINFEDMIPINKKANFNDTISITSEIILNSNDNSEMEKYLKDNYEYSLAKNIDKITITQKYSYENSEYKKRNFIWDIGLYVKKKRGSKSYYLYYLDKDQWLAATNFLKTKMPKILYFPTAFFDMPDRICLSENDADEKAKFFQLIVQDILDSLNDNLDIKTHIVDRVNKNEQSLIPQLCLRMSRKVNEIILNEWEKVLNNTKYSVDVKLYKDSKDENVYLEFKVVGQDGIFKLSERSLGFRWFFMFLLLTQFRGFRKNENRHIIFMFDEPAANLSNKAQKQLLQSLDRISDNCTIIYTTHSHHLISPNWLEGAHVVSNEALQKGDYESFNSQDTNIHLEKYRSYVHHNPQNTSYFQPILDLLEYVPNELDFSLPSVILEGKNDFYTLKYFFEVQNGQNDVCLVPGMSCSNVDTLISLFYSWGKEFIVLLDSDAAAKSSKKRYIDGFGSIVENRIFTLQDVNPKWTKNNMESILTNAAKLEIQNVLFPGKKYSKNTYNKTIQELLMTRKKIHIDETVLNDFNEIHKFCKKRLKPV